MDAPLFRDPVHDGAADPVVVYNPVAQEWCLVYTNRRADVPGVGVAWVHGTDLGLATSPDGAVWTYRGVLSGLEFEPGRNTFWAPEILFDAGVFHMFVSYIQGVPQTWTGAARIHHYTSRDFVHWGHHGEIPLTSDRVIDACVFELPGSTGWRMWFKDEPSGSKTWFADSQDLYNWEVRGPVIDDQPHEGPNVFQLGEWYWLLVDEWCGQAVYRSADLEQWTRQPERILAVPGARVDDGQVGLHADVVVCDAGEEDERAYIFYFTHPERRGLEQEDYLERRSSLQVAALQIVGDGLSAALVCDRDADLEVHLS